MRKGNILLGILVLVGIIAAASVGGYFWWSLKPTIPENTPTATKNTLFPTSMPNNENLTPEEAQKSLPLSSQTANWKIYTNTKYNYEIKYPSDWTVGVMNSSDNVSSSSLVNFRKSSDQTPAESGYIVAVMSPENLLVSQICQKNGQYTGGASVQGFLCGKKILTNTKILNGISWEVLDKDSVGYVPSGQITHNTIHNNKLYFVISFSGSGETYFYDQILHTFKFLDQKGDSETLTVDFSVCQAGRKRVDVAFGSTTYEIIGKKANACEINYGGEVENPNWDDKLNTNCLVPASLGKVKFGTTQYGVDFSSIKNYCLTK